MILDLIILAIGVLCIVIGVKRGLVLSLLSALSLVIAIFLGYLLMPAVGSVVARTSFPERTENAVYEVLYKEAEEKIAEPDCVRYQEVLKESSLPSFVKDRVEKLLSPEEQEGALSDVSRAIASRVAGIAVKVLAFLIVAVLVFVGMLVARILWKGVRKMPVLHQLDTAGGFLFGLIESVLLISGLMLFLYLISAGSGEGFVTEQLRQSVIGARIYRYNLLGVLLALWVH